jgi:hypothetical protein
MTPQYINTMEKDSKNHQLPSDANPVLSVGLIVSIFAAAGYAFTEENPSGRLLFWHGATEQPVQLWYDDKTDLTKVMDLICGRAYDAGESWGKHTVATEIKKTLGILPCPCAHTQI